MNAMDYDVTVIGGGAAGLNAALVLARAQRAVAVVDAGEPRNAPAEHMHGFLSRDGSSPSDMLSIGREEVHRYGGRILADQVRDIERSGDGRFAVRLATDSVLHARAVLVATGLRDELPEIPGVRERWGSDVLHCPYCHGYEVRDTALGVLGGDVREFSLHQAFLLRRFSTDVTFFPHRIELSDDERTRLIANDVRIADGVVTGLVVQDGRLRGVEVDGCRTVPRAAVFVAPRFIPNDVLLTGLGCAVGENGWVVTDPGGRTSVPGVWAAGNVVDPRAQVVTAAGAGSAAAIALNGYLLEQDVQRATARHQNRTGGVGAVPG
ncbi:NAD(P)/FAD-dependent oxidoreductase [Phytoactinopolyspora halotolerans]|uniref:NAD(P)/FAD-dependent oxidoreductase n=1 Tax=Phytoactinopolyspora halotolerans TaxID=1981512 RepID=A0A6L9SDF0_9ACTN|nr:NAD(P)/FAD-dependent oxidoreductase [Phytoactinopolyspora halotolerans]NEE02521.1 NAD(P)/FAD-dependent oxidoreductase [Phytoactinopolyspora halotolerans]